MWKSGSGVSKILFQLARFPVNLKTASSGSQADILNSGNFNQRNDQAGCLLKRGNLNFPAGMTAAVIILQILRIAMREENSTEQNPCLSKFVSQPHKSTKFLCFIDQISVQPTKKLV